MSLRCCLPLLLLFVGACADEAFTGSQDASIISCRPGNDCATACGEGEICAGSYGHFNSHQAACLKKCDDDTDCAAGMRCGELYDEGLKTAVCISTITPGVCGNLPDTWHCDFAGPSCRDAMTLMRGFSQRENGTCGYEYVHCPSRCVTEGDGPMVGHCE